MSVPDNKILGSYRLIERIGKGGMGEVFRAQHLKLGRESAVKLLPVSLAGEADFLKRFEREAASVASLDHPNILPIWEYGEADGVPYLVMPLVRGGTLKERLEQGPIPLPEITRYLQQMADALDYAHGQGLVHRDVKPANMLMGDRGRLYLSDFGIAKALEGTESLTRTGVGVGTPEYMAPEQAQGRADPRSDLYALGIVLYQMLTGRVPYSGSSAVEILLKHIQEPPPLLPLRNVPSLPPAIERVVEKALAKNPNERYQSGQALVEAFSEAQVTGLGRTVLSPPNLIGVGPDPGATVAGPLGGLAGEATVRGVTPPPGLQGATVVGGFPAGGGQTPPPPYGQGATATGGGFAGGQTPPPQYGQEPTQFGPGPSSPGGGNTPGFGQTPPPGAYGQGAGATPSPAYGTPTPVVDPRQATPRKSRTPLLLGGLGAAALLGLLACVGLFFTLSRSGANANATATAGVAAGGTSTAGFLAQVTSTAGTNATGTAAAIATATAGAPTATPPPPSATPVAPTATTAPTVAPTATTAAVVPVATPAPTRLPDTPTSVPATATPTARPANTPTAAAAAQAPRPNGTVPPGWKVYTGTLDRLPFVMAYPPDWTVEEEEDQVTFTAPNGLSTLFFQSSGVPDPSANIDVLRNQYFNQTRSTLCQSAGDEGTSRQTRGGVVFAELKASCDYVDQTSRNATQFALYIGAGLREGVEWDFTMLTLYPNFDAELRNNYTPMLNTLNIYANPRR